MFAGQNGHSLTLEKIIFVEIVHRKTEKTHRKFLSVNPKFSIILKAFIFDIKRFHT